MAKKKKRVNQSDFPMIRLRVGMYYEGITAKKH